MTSDENTVPTIDVSLSSLFSAETKKVLENQALDAALQAQSTQSSDEIIDLRNTPADQLHATRQRLIESLKSSSMYRKMIEL